MALDFKMNVDVSKFKKGMQEASNSVKTLDAQLKTNEKQLKATGDAEVYMTNKAGLLEKQLEEQQKVVKNANDALQAMKDKGVSPASAEFQKMEQTLAGAMGKMFDIRAELEGMATSGSKAAGGAKELEKNLSNINRNVSLDMVSKGIEKITTGLENAAKKAISLGQSIFDEVVNAAKWADDTKTMAEMYEIPVDTLLRMQKLEALGLDTSTDAILTSMSRVKKVVGKESAETMATLRELGLVTVETLDTGFGMIEQDKRLFSGADDLFWKAGKAIMAMGDAYDKEAAAQAIFGKSWRELIPLFDSYKNMDDYQQALDGVQVTSEDTVDTLAELDDRLKAVEAAWNDTKLELLKALAPALQDAAGALADLLNRVNEYLKSEEGQKKLEAMEEAVSKLFGDLQNIDPEDVVNKFAGVLKMVTDSFTWIGDHWGDVKMGLKMIAGAFGLIKVGTLALNIGKIVSGFQTLWNGAHNPHPQLPGADTPATPSGTGTAAKTAGKAGFGAWLTDALGISGWGAMGGLTISAGIVYFGGKAIANLNDAANLGREVATDQNRYANLSDDQKGYLQGAVRALQHESGGSDRIDDMLLGLAGRMGGDLMGIFDYTNTSGEKRNKLADMLGMDDVNAAMAAAMIQAAGVDPTGLAGFDSALGKWNKFRQDGMDDWTAAYTTLAGLGGFFDRSGMMVDGKFTIPGYEARRIMSGSGPNPWELSGYAMTLDANKPKTYTYSDYNSQGELVSGWTGIIEQTWDPLKTKSGELETTFSGLNEAVPVTNEEIRKLGEESETAMGHVSKFGELAGGSEHSVQDLGAAAASAAAALLSIRVPDFFFTPHANGMPFVPYDGYLAMLHKGERVVPAREAGGSFSSNLYVESMIMNNGTDAEGLAAAMAAAQRRTMSGYGS